MLQIRKEQPQDKYAIRLVNEKAFGQSKEANIIDKLRQSCNDLLSLVAAVEGRVVGYILFSPVTIENEGYLIEGMGLAPFAILPEYQRRGIGSSLVQESLRILRESSCPFVIVLGHPEYYRRFGFEMASKYGIKSQWQDVPDEVFMIIIFDKKIMQGVAGAVKYRCEFNEVV